MFSAAIKKMWPETLRQARRLIILVGGVTLVACGVVMILTPGPGSLLILGGLSLLAIEFVWARRLLRKVKLKSAELGRAIFDSHQK
jgi:tellurite resistance protein TerC